MTINLILGWAYISLSISLPFVVILGALLWGERRGRELGKIIIFLLLSLLALGLYLNYGDCKA